MAGASPSLSTLTGERDQHYEHMFLPIFVLLKSIVHVLIKIITIPKKRYSVSIADKLYGALFNILPKGWNRSVDQCVLMKKRCFSDYQIILIVYVRKSIFTTGYIRTYTRNTYTKAYSLFI